MGRSYTFSTPHPSRIARTSAPPCERLRRVGPELAGVRVLTQGHAVLPRAVRLRAARLRRRALGVDRLRAGDDEPPDEQADRSVEERQREHREVLRLHPETTGEVGHADDECDSDQPTDDHEDQPLLLAALAGRRDAQHPDGRRQDEQSADQDEGEQQEQRQEGEDRLDGRNVRSLSVGRAGHRGHRHHLGRQDDHVDVDDETPPRHRDRRSRLRRSTKQLHGKTFLENLNRQEHTNQTSKLKGHRDEYYNTIFSKFVQS